MSVSKWPFTGIGAHVCRAKSGIDLFQIFVQIDSSRKFEMYFKKVLNTFARALFAASYPLIWEPWPETISYHMTWEKEDPSLYILDQFQGESLN